MKNRRIRTILIISILIVGCGLYVLTGKYRPSEIVYIPYNGLSTYYKIYYVTSDKLVLDTTSHYYFDSIRDIKNFRPKFEKSVKIDNSENYIVEFPLRLLFERNRTIGEPDVIDQGGIIIKFNMFGINKCFNIDPFEKDKFYHPLIDSIGTKITRVNVKIKTAGNRT